MRIFLLFLLIIFLAPQLHSQTDNNAPCWGATLNTDFDYSGSDELQKTYTATEIVGIYTSVISASELDEPKEYVCTFLWPYLSFLKNGFYDNKELTDASTAFIQAAGTEEFLNRLNNLDYKLRLLDILKGYNGKYRDNDNKADYEKFSKSDKNLFFIEIMDNNEKAFLSLRSFLNRKEKSSLKDVTGEDLFNFVLYLNSQEFLDKDYFPRLEEFKDELMSEFKKI